eukprot:g46289.t1
MPGCVFVSASAAIPMDPSIVYFDKWKLCLSSRGSPSSSCAIWFVTCPPMHGCSASMFIFALLTDPCL